MVSFPHQRIATAADDDDVRSGAVPMGALVRADRKLGDVALQRVVGELDLGGAVPLAARLGLE